VGIGRRIEQIFKKKRNEKNDWNKWGELFIKKFKHIRKWRKSVSFVFERGGGVEEDVAQCTYGWHERTKYFSSSSKPRRVGGNTRFLWAAAQFDDERE
jgi:hypothetical protein